MSPDSLILGVLQLAPRLLQVAIVVAMLRRGWHREVPFFFCYTVQELVQISVLVPLYNQPNHGYPPYFYWSWAFVACSTVFRFGMLYEVFQHLIRPYEAFQSLARSIMRWSVLIFLLVGILVVPYAPTSDANTLLRDLMVLKTCVIALQLGLVLVLFMLASSFHVSWPHRLFGIALGLGLYVSLQLAVTALRSQMGMLANSMVYYVDALGYACAIGVWSYYILLPERIDTRPPTPPPNDLEKWNQELLRLLQR
jgi:hypothetical protein